MQKNNIFYGTVFLALLSMPIYLLLRPEHEAETQGQALASIASSSGQVETRSEDALLWNDIVKKQPLSSGQWVGTGPNGTALIRFQDGRELRLGPGTQIVVDVQAKDHEEPDFVVTLLKGNLKALAHKSGNGKTAALVIKSKSEFVRLGPALDEVDLHQQLHGRLQVKAASHSLQVLPLPPPSLAQRPVPAHPETLSRTEPLALPHPEPTALPPPKPVALLQPKPVALLQPKPVALLQPAPAHQVAKSVPAGQKIARTATPASIPPVQSVTPLAVASAPARLAAAAKAPLVAKTPVLLPLANLTPQIQSDGEDQRLWTAKSLRGKDLVVPVTLSGPEELPQGLSWRPFVEVTAVKSGNKSARSEVPTHGTKLFSHPVPLPELSEVSVTSGMVKLVLQAGAKISRGEDQQTLRSAEVVRYVGSLSDMSNTAGLILHFKPGRRELFTTQDWFTVADEPGGDEQAPVTLKLAAGHDLRFLSGVLHRAKTLHITQDKPGLNEREAIYFVRDQRIVAQAWGQALTPELIQELAHALGVVLTYRGTAAAFVARPTAYNELLATLKGSAPTKRYYIYDKRYGDPHYSLSASFTVGTPALIDYLKRGATAVFTQPVEFLEETTYAH